MSYYLKESIEEKLFGISILVNKINEIWDSEKIMQEA